MATNPDNLISDLNCDVIIDSSEDFFAHERAYDVETESFETSDPLSQMCHEEGTDEYELWLETLSELDDI